MTPSLESPEVETEEFSLPLFVLTVLATLVGLLAALRLFVPDVWAAQFVAPAWKGAVAFVVISLVNAFVEYFFHRYLLHTPAVPFLRRLYKQHTLHHALTRIARKTGRDGRGILFIENKFPITEPEQGEASFFPWYSLAVFALLLSPLLALLQCVFPSFPWFLAALAVSLTLYEVLHAISHWPFEKWEPLIQHPRWGWFWRPAYAFHLRHHAVIDWNESISGFFGLPVADWAFGTCVVPQTVYAEGEEWTPDKFRSPRPRWIIRALDHWADRVTSRSFHHHASVNGLGITRSDATGAIGCEKPAGEVDRRDLRGCPIFDDRSHSLLQLGMLHRFDVIGACAHPPRTTAKRFDAALFLVPNAPATCAGLPGSRRRKCLG